MDALKLPTQIVRLDAAGPPRRQLELSCKVTNPAPFDICILDAWITVDTIDGLKLAEGRLFHGHYALTNLAVTRSGQQCSGVITIELPSVVLHQMEERRAGADVTLRISSRIIACEVRTQAGTITLGAPLPTQFEDTHSGYLEYTIPQSDWIKMLRRLGWSEFELLEIPSRDLNASPTLARALKRLEDALNCYRRGDWDESMANCRKVFEALVKDASGEDAMSRTPQVINSFIGEGPKAESINNIIKELSDFLQFGRHERLPVVSIKSGDAELALRLTAALLVYLAGK